MKFRFFVASMGALFFSVQILANVQEESAPVHIYENTEMSPIWYVGAFEKDGLEGVPTFGKNADGGNYSLSSAGKYKGYELIDVKSENCGLKTPRNKYESEEELKALKDDDNAEAFTKLSPTYLDFLNERNPEKKKVLQSKWRKEYLAKNKESRTKKKSEFEPVWETVEYPPSGCRGRNFNYLETKKKYGLQTTTIQMCFHKGVANGKAFWITRKYDDTELARKELVYKDGVVKSSEESVTASPQGKKIVTREKQLMDIQSKGRPVYKVSTYSCAPRWVKMTKKWVKDSRGKQFLKVTTSQQTGTATTLIPIETVFAAAKEDEARIQSAGRSTLTPSNKSRATK